ncbi:MAG: 3-hydroxyacyl-CoA dehydrogenase NAD-binding domain-containing protein, partial [Alphaproteobacteria bacterium]
MIAEAENEHPPIPEIARIGVVGAGQMGSGIAQVAAQSGFDVRLLDVDQARLDAAMARIKAGLERLANRGNIQEAEVRATLARIHTGLDYGMFADSELVIEAASENEEIKRKILQSLLAVLRPEAVIATNTSSISITRLAATTDRPE